MKTFEKQQEILLSRIVDENTIEKVLHGNFVIHETTVPDKTHKIHCGNLENYVDLDIVKFFFLLKAGFYSIK